MLAKHLWLQGLTPDARKRQQQQLDAQVSAAQAAAAARGVSLLDDPEVPTALKVCWEPMQCLQGCVYRLCL